MLNDRGMCPHKIRGGIKMTQAEKIEEIIAKIEKLNELELEIRADMADIGIDYDSIGAEYQVYCSRSKLRDKGE
jgi:uncharacterized protein (UPF0335 family)